MPSRERLCYGLPFGTFQGRALVGLSQLQTCSQQNSALIHSAAWEVDRLAGVSDPMPTYRFDSGESSAPSARNV